MMIRNIFILLTMLSMTGIANAATITVDDSGGADYTKIQDAVNAASTGDTIEVRSGTYYENVNVNKRLILRGMDTGEGKPVVDAGGSGSAIILSMGGIILENFYATNAGTGILLYYSDGNLLVNNIASNNADKGILLYSSNNNILKDNTNTNNVGEGIYLHNSKNNEVINNINSNNIRGIYLGFSSNNMLNNNTNSYGTFGIDIDEYSSYNELRNNINFGNGAGIWMAYFSDNNLLTNNIVSNNGAGIEIFNSHNNILNGNIADYNSYYGIYISYSTQGGKVLPSTNNTLYKNNLSNNGYNAIDFGTNNQWDNGIDIGNHYSDFDEPSEGCNDTDSNGICDSIYIIGSSIDRYPVSIGGSGCGNTPSGQNTYVNPSPNVDMIYDNVVQCGNTSVTAYSENQWSSLPNNYQGISFNDIQTTATYSNDIMVNIAYSDQDISGIDESSIKMFHYENGDWIDVTTSLDIANNKVTGTVNSLSPFAIAGSSSGTPTPTISPTTTPISGGGTVRGSSLNIISAMILTMFLIIVSVLRIRKN